VEEYRGEQFPRNKVWPEGRWVHYFTKMREAFRLTIRDGLLYDSRGKPFDTAAAPEGKAMFVMDRAGNIYAWSTERVPGRRNHSSLLAGGPVATAGEIKAAGGRITDVSNESGHYETTLEMLNQFIYRLRWGGVDVSGIKVEPYKGP